MAKSLDPEYSQLKAYVRDETKKRAMRKWRDAGGEELSELVQHLLEKYLGT